MTLLARKFLQIIDKEEERLRQYGHSKASRPNPTLQMGLYPDVEEIRFGRLQNRRPDCLKANNEKNNSIHQNR